MSVASDTLASPVELERRVGRAATAERVKAVILLVMVLVGGAIWLEFYAATFMGTSIGLFLVALWLYWPSGEGWDVHHIDDVDPELLGRFTKAELRSAIDEVRQSYGEKEFPNIFVIDTTMPVAMTRNADLINFVRSWNAVWISRHLLEVLTEDELKSIFAHEMCHYSKHTTFWGRYFYLHGLCCAFLVSFSYVVALDWFFPGGQGMGDIWIWVAVGCALGLFPLITLLANLVVIGVGTLTERGDSQAIEFLCDYEAAKRYGPIPMTNALLKVSTRTEIFTRAVMSFSAEEYVMAEESEEDEQAVTQEEAAQAAIEYLEAHLPMGFVSVEDAQEQIDAAIAHGLETVDGAKSSPLKVRTFLRWLKYDNRVRNQRLDLGEYEDFIDAVGKAPEDPLFAIPEEIDPELEAAAEHPSIRKRVLFLAQNLRPKELAS